VPLLNAAYNAWKAHGDAPTPGPTPTPLPGGVIVRAPRAATVVKGRTATLKYEVTQAVLSGTTDVTIRIRNKVRKLVKTLKIHDAPVNSMRRARFHCTLKKGVYRFSVFAVDDAGVRVSNVASNKLRVK
jgi:hypothetical protein